MTEVQDSTGYDQAMEEYYYKKSVYDKTIEDSDIDDDTIILDSVLMEHLDEDLDQFFDELMKQ